MCAPQYVALLTLMYVCAGRVGPWVVRARGSRPGTTCLATCPTSSSASSPQLTSSSTASWATSSGTVLYCTVLYCVLSIQSVDWGYFGKLNGTWLHQQLLTYSNFAIIPIELVECRIFLLHHVFKCLRHWAFVFYSWQRKWDKIVFIEAAFWMNIMNLET